MLKRKKVNRDKEEKEMTKRYGLKDEQWEKIKDLLPGTSLAAFT